MVAATPTTLPCSPTLDEFRRLAAGHRIVPVWSEVVADTLTPVAAYRHVVGDGVGFLLESVEGGERWGRFSFVGRAPLATLVARGREVSASGPLGVSVGEGGVLAALEGLLDTYRSPALEGLPPLFAGVVGYLGYDVVREIEHLPDVPRDDQGFPDAGLVVIGQLCAFDHWRQRVVLVDNVVIDPRWGPEEVEAAYRDAGGRLEDLGLTACVRPPSTRSPFPTVSSRFPMSPGP
jgi:anthranilate synthase component 1